MKHGSLCTGYGGLDMAAQAVFGGELIWWSDVDTGPISVMEHHNPGVPNLGDLKTVDWSTTPEIGLLTAGYPCQPFSAAGKRLGTKDPRHLWPYIARAIGVLRPRIVILENVSRHLREGFNIVLSDLTALGYSIAWTIVRASDIGAAPRRERLFVLATDTQRAFRDQRPGCALTRTGPTPLRQRTEKLRRHDCPVADPSRQHEHRGGHVGPKREAESTNSDSSTTYSQGIRRREGGAEHERVEWRPDASHNSEPLNWQEFEPAIRQWESVLGRPAPAPSVLGPRGGVKVSPRFGEWLMGLPDGHVSAVPGLSINEQLKLLGNGVLPHQAVFAIRYLAYVLGLT